MESTAEETTFKEYEVNTVYYLVQRKHLGEKWISDIFTTWQCVDSEVKTLSGCKRREYKFVQIIGGFMKDSVPNCVEYTSGRPNDVPFMTFDEFAELVARTKVQRDKSW